MKILTKARWLSLDITLGALVLLFFISDILLLEPDIHVYIALAIAIWSIYTLDHLNDARKLNTPTSDRHKFHKAYFRPILLVQLLILTLGLINLFFLDRALILLGLSVGVFSGLYLLLQHFLVRAGMKELAIAVGYTTGIVLYPISKLGPDPGILLMAILLFMIAYVNIVLISYYDRKADKADGSFSIALLIKPGVIRKILYSMIGIAICFSVVSSFYGLVDSRFVFFTVSAQLVLFVVLTIPGFFERNDRFRLFSDFVFFIPLFIHFLF